MIVLFTQGWVATDCVAMCDSIHQSDLCLLLTKL